MRLATPARPGRRRVPRAASLLAGGAAHAHGDRDRAERMAQEYDAGLAVPFISSPNVRLAAVRPGSAGHLGLLPALGAVLRDVRARRRHGLRRERPGLAPPRSARCPALQFENEAMNCGERKVSRERTDRFAMIGVDLFQASTDDLEHVNDPATGDYELVIVDVTDPTDPARALTGAGHDQHAHGDLHRRHRLPLRLLGGRRLRGAGPGQLLRLRPHRPRPPRRGGQRPGHAGHAAVPLRRRRLGWAQVERRRRRATPTHTGAGGSYVYDARAPLHPVEVANTGAAGDTAREGSINQLQRLHPPQQLPAQRDGLPARTRPRPWRTATSCSSRRRTTRTPTARRPARSRPGT